MQDPSACYVHIPFCEHKCAYCDFNSYSGYSATQIQRYVEAIVTEIGSSKQYAVPLDTIFFGGGTPTAIPASDEARILRAVLDRFPIEPDAEITTEANPGSTDIIGLEHLRRAGFNRISFGVQSFDDRMLKALGRVHSACEAEKAVEAAHASGFDNISLDLMFGLPGQAMDQWKETLERAFSLGTTHISLYNLIVEEGTGFGTLQRKGKLKLPEDDLTADMYQTAIDYASANGFVQYEISNFAKPGRECRHNIHYWRNDSYYGFGAGAVSYLDGVRATHVLRPGKYVETIQKHTDLTHESVVPTLDEQMGETMMLGLRLTREGVDVPRFRSRYGIDPLIHYRSVIDKFVGFGLLEADSDRIVLTPRGVFLANDVMAAFL